MAWRVFAASTTGKAHTQSGQSCQDAYAVLRAGDVLCAAVCDGAGSAAAGQEGARYVADGTARALFDLVEAGLDVSNLSLVELRVVIEGVVERLHGELVALAAARGVPASDYSTTLVGALCSGEGGWLFHVGDGAGVAYARSEGMAPVVSPPENGEYANETYFVTGHDWRAHLRLTPACMPLHGVVLMSDGAATFAMNRGCRAPYPAFLDPVFRFLESATEDAGTRALSATLNDPRTHAITADDRTLVIALHHAGAIAAGTKAPPSA